MELGVQVVVIGVLVETLGESIWWVVEKGWSKERITALVLGLLVAAVTGADIFALAGLPIAGYVPEVLAQVLGVVGAGLVAMRGANFVHDLLGKLGG